MSPRAHLRAFVQETQPEAWAALSAIHGAEVEERADEDASGGLGRRWEARD